MHIHKNGSRYTEVKLKYIKIVDLQLKQLQCKYDDKSVLLQMRLNEQGSSILHCKNIVAHLTAIKNIIYFNNDLFCTEKLKVCCHQFLLVKQHIAD